MSEIRLLSEIATLQYGGAFSSKAFNTEGKGLPLIRIRDVQRGYSETYFDGEYDEKYLASDGDFLISMDGSFTLGEWRGGKALLNQRVCLIRGTSDEVDLRYLVAILPRYLTEIEARTPFVTVKHLSAKALNAIEIPLPNLQEQQRIADQHFLQKLIGEKRERQQALFEELERSRFVEEYGNPITNPKNLPMVSLAEIAKIVTGNSPSRSDDSNFGEYIEWIKSNNLGKKVASEAEEFLSPTGAQKARIAPEGSILVTCIAGSLSSIGKCSLLDREVSFNQQINAIIPHDTSASEFIWKQIHLFPELIQRNSTGGMKGLVSKSEFSKIKIIYPQITINN